MPPHADAISDCVISTFNALPTKFKPRKLVDGRREWVPLAGIVLSRGRYLFMFAKVLLGLVLTALLAEKMTYKHPLPP